MNQAFGVGPMGFSSLSGLLESVDAMKKAWSNFSLPSSLAPTMDLDELDKRIADLKTVEQWLNVNLAMLRGTIQGMEIQRGTVAAIRAFGQTVAPDTAAMASAAAEAAKAAQEAARRETDADRAGAPEPGRATGEEAPQATGAAAVNPGTWWNLLQSQFNQVAQAAMANPLAASAAAAAQAAVRSDRTEAPSERSKAASAARASASNKKGKRAAAQPSRTPRSDGAVGGRRARKSG